MFKHLQLVHLILQKTTPAPSPEPLAPTSDIQHQHTPFNSNSPQYTPPPAPPEPTSSLLTHSQTPCPAALPMPQLPTATPPVSQRTRSHTAVPPAKMTIMPPISPPVLQSQARALPFLSLHLDSSLVSSTRTDSPVSGRTRGKISQRQLAHCSPYPSPLAITGARRKQHPKFKTGILKLPSLDSHTLIFSPYSQGTQKDLSTHRRKKHKPY